METSSACSYRGKTLLPRYVWLDGKLEENVPIAIDSEGVIAEIGGVLPYDVIRLEHEVEFARSNLEMKGKKEINSVWPDCATTHPNFPI